MNFVALLFPSVLFRCCCYYFVLSQIVYYSQSEHLADTNLFNPGEETEFIFDNTISINDAKYSNRDLGYQMSGNVAISSIWSDTTTNLEKLLYFRISKLETKSHKNAAEFKSLRTNFEKLKNNPFIVHWKNYKVQEIYTDTNEDEFLINLKKALAGLFQFQLQSGNAVESDVTGNCNVSYELIDDHMVLRKRVNKCNNNLPKQTSVEKMLEVNVTSTRDVLYQFNDKALYKINKITSYEKHFIQIIMDEKVAIAVTATLDLTLYATRKQTSLTLHSSSIKEALEEMKDSVKNNLKPQILPLNNWQQTDSQSKTKSLKTLLREHYDNLTEKHLGTVKSASSFLTLLTKLRNSDEEEIIAVLKNKKNKPIMNQICDLTGAAQTIPAHNAIVSNMNFTSNENLDCLERYLLTLSLGCCPQEDIIKDLISTWEKTGLNRKLEETLILTITTMSRKLYEMYGTAEYLNTVLSILENRLSNCENDNCVAVYLRSLKNVPHSNSVKLLVNYSLTGSRLTSVTALKTLYHFPKRYWSSDVLKMADDVYYQKYRKYDSTARAVAADIILENNPDKDTLKRILLSVRSFDPAYETKRYVLQRIQQISSLDEKFYGIVKSLFNSTNLNNYDFLAQKGLSNALSRKLFHYSGAEVLLHSINEAFNGVTKRSVISVAAEKENDIFPIFSLETYSSGLSSFLSSDSSAEVDLDEPEDIIAGVKLMLFGAQIRPYVFFKGQTELMGHVWSGTASDRTPAFQAIMLLHDHRQYIPLATGDVIEVNFLSASSFELAGQISFSIWNRNAKSLVQTLSGTHMHGTVGTNTPFIGAALEFDVGSDLSLDLFSDLDFYSEIALCFRLSHPNLFVRHSISRKEWTPNDEHKFSENELKTLYVPGRTFSLGRINNEMCKTIYGN